MFLYIKQIAHFFNLKCVCFYIKVIEISVRKSPISAKMRLGKSGRYDGFVAVCEPCLKTKRQMKRTMAM